MGQGRENARVFLKEHGDIRAKLESALRKKLGLPDSGRSGRGSGEHCRTATGEGSGRRFRGAAAAPSQERALALGAQAEPIFRETVPSNMRSGQLTGGVSLWCQSA